MFSRYRSPLAFAVFGALLAVAIGHSQAEPGERTIRISARRYAYDPPRITVNRGDTIHLKLSSKDVIHGFYLEGYDIDATIVPQQKAVRVKHPLSNRPQEEVETVTFVADRRGKFRYRCSHTCGSMHPFMTGEMIVRPNTPLHAGLGMMVGLFVGVLVMFGNERYSLEVRARSSANKA